jgi:hypothetical protein
VTAPPDPSQLSHAEKDALIAILSTRLAAVQEATAAQSGRIAAQDALITTLVGQFAVAQAKIAALEARIDELTRPPKTP